MNKLNKNTKGISLAFSQNNNVNEFLLEVTNGLENLIIFFSKNFDKNFCNNRIIEHIFWINFDENYENIFLNCKRKISLDVKRFYTSCGLDYISVLIKLLENLSKFNIEEFLEKKCGVFYNNNDCGNRINNAFNRFKSIFKSLLKRLEEFSNDYNMNFEEKSLHFASEKIAIDQINNQPLKNLFYKFIESTSFENKEATMIAISTKVVGLFQKEKESFKILLESNNPDTQIITSKIIDNLRNNLHGYFRHTPIDSNGNQVKKYSEWSKEQKAKVMNQIFYQIIYYLNLLSINDCKELKEIK